MKSLFLSWKKVVAAFCLLTAFFLEAQAQSEPTRESNNKNKSPVVTEPSVEELEAARIWLAKFNYNLTIDGVRKLKKVNITAGTLERADAITTANMKNLRVLTNLESLTLNQPGDDAWVAEAADLSKLRVFTISPASNLTDLSAEIIGKWHELRILMVNGFKITDEGFAELINLHRLEQLGIQNAKITDRSAPILGGFTKLTSLSMSFTNITDAGLPYLYKLKNLKYLMIQSSKITHGAMELLRQRLPNCYIAQ